MKLLAIVVLVALVAAACGGSTTGGAECAPVPMHCYSCGTTTEPSCVNGQWVCPETAGACAVEGGTMDASRDGGDAAADGGDASDAPLDAGPFACGPRLHCDPQMQYCEEASGGPPPPPDAGSGVAYSCPTFPQACANNRTCACLRANNVCGGALVDCKENAGDVTASCAFP